MASERIDIRIPTTEIQRRTRYSILLMLVLVAIVSGCAGILTSGSIAQWIQSLIAGLFPAMIGAIIVVVCIDFILRSHEAHNRRLLPGSEEQGNKLLELAELSRKLIVNNNHNLNLVREAVEIQRTENQRIRDTLVRFIRLSGNVHLLDLLQQLESETTSGDEARD